MGEWALKAHSLQTMAKRRKQMQTPRNAHPPGSETVPRSRANEGSDCGGIAGDGVWVGDDDHDAKSDSDVGNHAGCLLPTVSNGGSVRLPKAGAFVHAGSSR